MQSITPLLAVLVSMIASVLILAFGKYPNIREGWTFVAAFIKFGLVISMLPMILKGTVITCTVVEMLPNLPIAFKVDAFGILFAITSSFLWIFVSSYSIGYMRSLNEHAQTRYFFCFAIALSSAVGIAFSANLITLFLFYELLTISTYPLVAHIETPEAISSGRKYLTYLMIAGISLLFSILVVYHHTGTTEFSFSGIAGMDAIPQTTLVILFITFMIGCAKAAFMPLHAWLPAAMIAPTPVSALLHAVAVVKAGVFTAVRVILYVFGVDLMQESGIWLYMAYFVSITIILASIYALMQDNLKKRLAYSTVSQLSYIVLGAVLITPHGITGGMLHIPYHAFMKITLFMCAGALIVTAKKENISDMNGIARQMPITMLAFTVGALGMIGMPPAGGYVTKWFLLLGAAELHSMILIAVLLVSAVLNAAYFFPVIYVAFFKKPDHKLAYKEAPLTMLVPLVLTAIISIVIGVWPDAPGMFLDIVEIAVANVTGGI
ncbi:MAG: monovalent cation/H+ antiporter subunit D family protein [Methanosarcinales archaeon]|nr:monovalent cation/H+ antiporter subunit D family protein [Methanosarcinales archaeon]MCK4651942.1 monovalent cation/H+ antiporter subunit D family protein [Methanosarcinales archaeon]